MTNPSATGIDGFVRWHTDAINLITVELRENVSSQIGTGTLYASTVTAVDGYFRVAGATTTNLKVEFSDPQHTRNFVLPISTAPAGVCADQINRVGGDGITYLLLPIHVPFWPVGTTATVTTDPVTVVWDPLAVTAQYCVALQDLTVDRILSDATCGGNFSAYAEAGTARRYTTPGLVAGHNYVLRILAIYTPGGYAVGIADLSFTSR